MRAFAFKKGFAREITEEDACYWHLLADIDTAGTDAQVAAMNWKEPLERDFADSHRRGRVGYQEVLDQNPLARPRSFSHFLKSFRAQGSDIIYPTIRRVYKKQAKRDLARDAMWQLLERVPHLLLYSAGWLHEIYYRAVRESNFSPKGKPGTLDLWCAVYLPHCDALVTNDRGQCRALRMLNVLSKRMPPTPVKTRVLMYRRFRAEILG